MGDNNSNKIKVITHHRDGGISEEITTEEENNAKCTGDTPNNLTIVLYLLAVIIGIYFSVAIMSTL